MGNNTLLDRLKHEFKIGGIVKQLILINAIVFLSLILLEVFAKLFNVEFVYVFIFKMLALPGDLSDVIFQPWSIITNIFVHSGLSHFFWNMLVLYFIGRLYTQFFSDNRLLVTFIIGGVVGSLLQVSSYYIFPYFENAPHLPVVGASGAVYALIGAILYYRPRLEINLFIITVPFWIIGMLFILSNIVSLTTISPSGGVAYFAHVGGVAFGFISVMNLNSSKQFTNRMVRFWENTKWKNPFKRRTKFKIYKNEDIRKMSDDEYRGTKKGNQEKVNAILEKISKGGYDSLTKAEKEFLFKFGNDL